jgi:hypothetical protein
MAFASKSNRRAATLTFEMRFPVGASLLAMDDNDYAFLLLQRVA